MIAVDAPWGMGPSPVLAHSLLCKSLAEFVGTFFIVFTVGCNILTSSVGAALSIGSILMAMSYSLGSVSGGHFNPAVTLAVIGSTRRLLSMTQAAWYVAGQLVGALLGAITCSLIFGWSFTIEPSAEYTVLSVCIVEALYTMALCYVVLNITTTQKQDGSNYFGLAIGFTVVSAALAIGGISGCCLNPAIAIAASVVSTWQIGLSALVYLPLYILVGFVGAGMACVAFYLVQRADEYSNTVGVR
jgi:aquaporin Z